MTSLWNTSIFLTSTSNLLYACAPTTEPDLQDGKLPALREVKHPHRDRTSVSRSPSTEQEVLSQFSGYSEEIGHFTWDPCKPHLKSCLQSTKHAFKKQEVNTHIDCEHSYRMEHAEHFPAPMEMCMDDHLTQTTERIQ